MGFSKFEEDNREAYEERNYLRGGYECENIKLQRVLQDTIHMMKTQALQKK